MSAKKPLPEKWFQSDFAKSLGEGLFFFLILIGIGGCECLCRHREVPLINIQTR